MKKFVLVVDDDVSVREALKKVLADAGYEVLQAADADEAEERFEENAVDLLLLDLNLPARDGWDVLGHVSARFPLLPVVMITGMYDQLDTAIIPGVRALLKKPLDVPVVLSTIETLLAESADERLRRVGEPQTPPERPGYLGRFAGSSGRSPGGVRNPTT